MCAQRIEVDVTGQFEQIGFFLAKDGTIAPFKNMACFFVGAKNGAAPKYFNILIKWLKKWRLWPYSLGHSSRNYCDEGNSGTVLHKP
jgi:hypothetical protein